jgi:hypothetical protein
VGGLTLVWLRSQVVALRLIDWFSMKSCIAIVRHHLKSATTWLQKDPLERACCGMPDSNEHATGAIDEHATGAADEHATGGPSTKASASTSTSTSTAAATSTKSAQP